MRLTRYYELMRLCWLELTSLDIDEVEQQSIITVLKGFVGLDDSFSKMERLEALLRACLSLRLGTLSV